MNADVEYIKNLPKDWQENQDTVILVGRTLHKYGYIGDIEMAFDFVEKPQNYQQHISDFVRDFSNG